MDSGRKKKESVCFLSFPVLAVSVGTGDIAVRSHQGSEPREKASPFERHQRYLRGGALILASLLS